MKKIRWTVRIITALLVLLSIVGIIILITNEKLDVLDTSYEIIAFSLGVIGMIMAVVAHVDFYLQERSMNRVIAKLTRLNREADQDEKVDEEFQKKLDKILSMDSKIIRKLEEEDAK
jgi:uncharacterized membrane protein